MVHVKTYAVEFGERLREERERLGLSQGDFASRAGVHRNTQVRYEKGHTQPLPDYLDTIKSMGVDTAYLFTGRSANERAITQLDEDLGRFGQAFVDVLRIPGEQLLTARESINSVMANNPPDDNRLDATLDAYFALLRDEFAKAVEPLVANSRYVLEKVEAAGEIDADLLAATIRGIEEAISEGGNKLSTEKKAALITMLYRAFQPTGKVQTKMIRDALALASAG